MDAPRPLFESKPWLKHYPRAFPTEVDIPEISIPQMFDQAADKYATRPPLIFYGKKITYKELKESDGSVCRGAFPAGV
jgi:long-chain acyl-CoA synthetase